MIQSLRIVKAFLDANLTDAVALVEAEESITITPLAYLDTYTPLGRQFPSLSILPRATEPAPPSAGNRPFFGNPSHRDELVIIQVWDRGNFTSTKVVENNVMGYMDSLDKLFKSDYEIAGIKGIDLMDTSYTELFPDPLAEGQLLLKGATLLIRVRYNIL